MQVHSSDYRIGKSFLDRGGRLRIDRYQPAGARYHASRKYRVPESLDRAIAPSRWITPIALKK